MLISRFQLHSLEGAADGGAPGSTVVRPRPHPDRHFHSDRGPDQLQEPPGPQAGHRQLRLLLLLPTGGVTTDIRRRVSRVVKLCCVVLHDRLHSY